MHVYVCVYMYVFMCIYVCVHVYMCMYVYVGMYVYIRVIRNRKKKQKTTLTPVVNTNSSSPISLESFHYG